MKVIFMYNNSGFLKCNIMINIYILRNILQLAIHISIKCSHILFYIETTGYYILQAEKNIWLNPCR